MDSLVYMSKPQIHLFKHYRNPKILKQGKKKAQNDTRIP